MPKIVESQRTVLPKKQPYKLKGMSKLIGDFASMKIERFPSFAGSPKAGNMQLATLQKKGFEPLELKPKKAKKTTPKSSKVDALLKKSKRKPKTMRQKKDDLDKITAKMNKMMLKKSNSLDDLVKKLKKMTVKKRAVNDGIDVKNIITGKRIRKSTK